MVSLGILHYIYIIMTIVIIVTLLMKKEIVLPCIIGTFLIGIVYSGNLLKAVQIMYNSVVESGTQFLGIIVVISLVVAMSRSLSDIGSDELMMKPIKKVIRTKKMAFFVIGFVMLIVSWFIWPSPAVALIGALLLPAALEVGLPAIWAASAMNLFGHGMGLSSDFFIQGAPAITGKAAGVSTLAVMKAMLPLWIVMSVVTVGVAFFMMLRDLKKNPQYENEIAATLAPEAEVNGVIEEDNSKSKSSAARLFIAVITPAAFIIDVIFMCKYHIVGGDATALVGGTAIIIMSIVTVLHGNLSESLERITDNLKEGFIFGIKIFAPVIVIASFFFMGSEETAKTILGPNARGLLNDIGMYLAGIIPMAKFPIALMQAAIGGITGLDGSGFSGLPLVGSLAQTFSTATGGNREVLAALGQIATVWVGGGTIIPWGVIPVAAICNVKPTELARRNLIPVLAGLLATIVVAMFMI
ncbi:transporter [Clostridium pasteurianum DSM 525 = ATCC 6013]|uniref:Transporter n=1 Tax=Clostridium pasteurianum DSM 525 = ATCC 6013 TaxID=1262449 RepID=A0A0H3JA40_CLOPA|nr:hypothetical protein [Clostridium pasteurianum]AJA49218.1 transporter [Clostridium pasteurianum DSM 525 = ATCC 6013]AJA53206.1 transporter [Clostridium pasteurianum DSM 525 = ATCC 6013]AOZ76400.1 hypothetical protein AQ983_15300 [Clostridium pasteurianum DSM 525 = ATCC 6013]AOZ80197.1 hypothetical protein AQ984_15295 [Clostridium pasteurianum]ELP59151.1 transporter [Clostridium pasteurianum DSM 525 = ATCC 6013]